eukprot:GHUV01001209.1.p1 GENE.GHUV01001209.1~~GHUV01001209.1.p1  ORF type:complete len:259 (+),score=81.50 GHUV01001209.1:1156-1932(+)
MACSLQSLQALKCCSSSAISRCHQQRTTGLTAQQCSRPLLICSRAVSCKRQLVSLASSIQPTAAVSANEVPTATTTAAAGFQHRALPFAALSRVLLNANNSTMFRTALNRQRQPVSGPMGLLLFLLTLIAASVATIRGALLKKGKSCKSCRGFGLQRCRLCLGSGRVDWAAKLKHFDVCPLCMNKRFIVCSECGGHYHRPMFVHRRRQVGGAFEPTGPAVEGPIVLTLAMAGAGNGGPLASMDGGSSSRGQIMSSMND